MKLKRDMNVNWKLLIVLNIHLLHPITIQLVLQEKQLSEYQIIPTTTTTIPTTTTTTAVLVARAIQTIQTIQTFQTIQIHVLKRKKSKNYLLKKL